MFSQNTATNMKLKEERWRITSAYHIFHKKCLLVISSLQPWCGSKLIKRLKQWYLLQRRCQQTRFHISYLFISKKKKKNFFQCKSKTSFACRHPYFMVFCVVVVAAAWRVSVSHQVIYRGQVHSRSPSPLGCTEGFIVYSLHRVSFAGCFESKTVAFFYLSHMGSGFPRRANAHAIDICRKHTVACRGDVTTRYKEKFLRH